MKKTRLASIDEALIDRSPLVLLALLLTALTALPACQSTTPPAQQPVQSEQPNILFILTDDQAPWAWSRSSRAPASLETPNMDRIARQGAYLPNAFTPTPVCSPSRASLLTSQYGTELGITDWIHPRREPDLGLDPETVTWPEVLQQAGYETGLVGKWHLGVPDRYHPTRAGFDYFMGFRTGGNSPKNPTLEKKGEKREFEGFTQNILTDHALQFIRDNQDEPFMLSVQYRAPHAPWLPLPEEDWVPYKNLDPALPDPDYPRLDAERVKRMKKEYMGSVASVDRNVGRLLDLLDELNLSDNTVVVFTSDHGYNMGHSGIWHKGNGHWALTDPPPATENIPEGQRPNMYDRSLRVPMAVRWPGVVEPRTVVEETVTFLDVYPTMLRVAGVERPEDVQIRGRSFLPLLEGRAVPEWNNDLYAEYSTHHQSRTHMRMYRTERWKLVRDFLNPKRDEFYDLKEDPAETTNLIDSGRPAVQEAIQRLDRQLLGKMRETGDPVLPLARRLSDAR